MAKSCHLFLPLLFPLCKLEIVIVTHEELVSVKMTAGVRCKVLPGTGNKDSVNSCTSQKSETGFQGRNRAGKGVPASLFQKAHLSCVAEWELQLQVLLSPL